MMYLPSAGGGQMRRHTQRGAAAFTAA